MASLSYSVTPSAKQQVKLPKSLIEINKLKNNNNVLVNFVNRAPHLGATYRRGVSFSPLTVKSQIVQPAVVQKTVSDSVVVVDGLEPAVLTPPKDLKKSDFPANFKWGASNSAIQTEGDGTEGGRGPSTWDFMIQANKGHKATNSYVLYKEDVKLLKEMGMTAYRFSISWSRILPTGTEADGGKINQAGIDYYNNFINELIANDIEPVVTLFHFDLPTALQQKYYGFLDSRIVEDFKNYAGICFREFGDRVKYWSTINEPYNFGAGGYKVGLPQTDEFQKNPLGPFIATHNIILAHAAAAKLYHDDYQKKYKGKIGISLPCQWFEPQTIDPRDVDAAQKQLDFILGWYMDPFVNGDYPDVMKELVRGIPEFTKEESKMLKTSCDYIGLNYYTARFAKQTFTMNPQTGLLQVQYLWDQDDTKGNPIGWLAKGQDGIYVYPDGMRKLLLYIKEKYNNPEVIVTENGVCDQPTITRSVQDSVNQGNYDELRIAFFDDYRISHTEQHLTAVREAIKGGAKVKGYFTWALMDNMEIGKGYDVRFGLNYTDYLDNFKRYPKKSAKWYESFLKGGFNDQKLRN